MNGERDRGERKIEMGYVGDLSVLTAIKDKNQERRTAIIFMGGGQKCIVSAGTALALENNYLSANICIGTSTGAVAGCYFVSGQSLEGANVLLKDVLEHRLLRPTKVGSIINHDGILETINNRTPLDLEALNRSNTEVFIGVTEMNGEGVFVNTKSVDNPVPYLVASMSHPIVTGGMPYSIDGNHYVDGCIGAPLPIEFAIDSCGATDILVVLTKSPFAKEKNSIPASLIQWAHTRKLGNELKLSIDSYETRLQAQFNLLTSKAYQEKARILAIYPDKLNVGQFTTNHDRLISALARSYVFTSNLLSGKY